MYLVKDKFESNLEELMDKNNPVLVLSQYLALYRVLLVGSETEEEYAYRDEIYKKLFDAIEVACEPDEEMSEFLNLKNYMSSMRAIKSIGL